MNYRILFLMAFLSLNAFAQNVIEYRGEKINALDEQGKPDGIWKLFDEENQLMIITEFKKGVLITPTKYYKNSRLIAIYKYEDGFEIYKDDKVFKARFQRSPDGSRRLIDITGNDLDEAVAKYFYDAGQIMPMFYGGKNELYSFIGNNVNYSKIKKNTGKVIIGFVIDAIGKVSEIEVIESSNPELNEEAKRVISIMPRWQPGHQAGAFVKCKYTIPVNIN
ncbi:energy transducer TonB [Flavobacterium sp. J372]|uniref:energy transducer TonB n=1 Tax=Flavobacterium sp. J372 TaxID=2898436 RepID=UPI002150A6C6|nr:energy transducer TonB [Flavobacterium sp. J372]MCR5861269.1 energy transducer TonB [Flavobacterium sp. J372]